MRKARAGAFAQSTAGPPLKRLQIEQWQYPASKISVSSKRIAPQKHPPRNVSMFRSEFARAG